MAVLAISPLPYSTGEDHTKYFGLNHQLSSQNNQHTSSDAVQISNLFSSVHKPRLLPSQADQEPRQHGDLTAAYLEIPLNSSTE